MYLVSIYFDEKTNKKIQKFIDQVAQRTGNTFMLDGNVPPHITVSAFEALQEEQVIEVLSGVIRNLKKDSLQWVSVGQFFPYVLYITPVLNEYLHDISVQISTALLQIDGVMISPYYQPFHWLPHSTIGKTLTKEQMSIAFDVMQNSFGMFEGQVVRIGLAKPNPHRDIMSWELK